MFVKKNPIRDIAAAKSSATVNVAVAHISIGSYYEIDHSVLPQRSPEQLKSVRIVLVSKITASDVTLRYPSMYSLRSHFNGSVTKPEKRCGGGLLPDLDESHVMASELAGELLYRRIAPHQVSVSRNSWSFWISGRKNLSRREVVSQPAYNTRTRLCRAASQVGKCWSELRSRGMVKWGKRLRVQYQSRDSRLKEEEQICKEEMEEEDDEADHGAKENMDGTNRKRKLMMESRNDHREEEKQIVVYRRKPEKKFVDRWSLERYKLAEKNMLKVMKEKNAVLGNSILRSELRSEARKLIGDTGLLDHLLKHMAGKVAPGGQERFRRKYNADGAMEYWLESSDLIHIRKEAGVDDPFWTPPPGWKIGDSPTQDPVCAAEIRELKEGLSGLKRELEKLASKKDEEELVVMATPNSCVTSQNDNLMTPAKEIYADLLKKKYIIEDQLAKIAEALRNMEEGMGWLQKTVEEKYPRKPDSTETTLLLEDSPTRKNQITKSPQKGKKGDRQEPRSPLSVITKTGFRICRPMGSFSWPRMPPLAAAAATETVTGNDEFASFASHNKPTYSSSPSSPPCPVKPLAAKRPLVLPFPFSVTPPQAPTNLFNL